MTIRNILAYGALTLVLILLAGEASAVESSKKLSGAKFATPEKLVLTPEPKRTDVQDGRILIQISNRCGKWLVIRDPNMADVSTRAAKLKIRVLPGSEIYSGALKGEASAIIFKVAKNYANQILDVCG